ncbi:MAG: Acetylornithine aminotransferase [Flavobacterium sp. SCGC AAA160-P02]|nr:MAG: Acetylornithine aminotransferase [Flavobacterium sp. SCGC AAA160-P02]
MKNDFEKYQAQTSLYPLSIEIKKAKGCYIYDNNGKKYLDFVAGVSANSLGHQHPKVTRAIKNQLDNYAHVMVYGEFIQKPQLELCKLLSDTLPDNYSIYLTNSGTEACEGALKLAKRYTKRSEIIAAHHSYHGNTQGSMSVSGAEQQNSAFRPLVPGVKFIDYNSLIDIEKITNKTAAVILETIQGGAGFIVPENGYLKKVKKRCEEVGAILILDEIQTGIGRTGKFWGFENFGITPDIIISGKGLGGGMPIGAFIAHKHLMDVLKENPALGHITTFGGHPVIASAGVATVNIIQNSTLIKDTIVKELLIRKHLQHPFIKEIRGKGLMLAAIVESPELAEKIIHQCLDKGLILFFLLFEGRAIRITPPLTITEKEIIEGCKILKNVLEELS